MLTHLIELRRRALYVITFFMGLFLLFCFYAPTLFHQMILPLLQVLPTKNPLIATQITTPVFIPMKLSADVACLFTAPFTLLQLWYFVAPALYRKERKGLRLAIFASLALFCLGGLFCYDVMIPLMLHFFAQAVPLGVRFMPDITYAIDFMTRMILLFGFCFQIPLVCLLLVSLNLVTIKTLKIIRPYVIVGAFILGMLLTPDVCSQMMLAIPLCLLFELGIVLSALVVRGARQIAI